MRGDLIDRAVTFRDLLDANVFALAEGQSVSIGGPVTPVLVTNPTLDGGGIEIPSAPTNVAVIAGFGFVRVTWSMAQYRGFGKVEIYRHLTDDIAAATAEGPDLLYFAQGNGSIDDTIVNSGTTYYYWVRGVNINGTAGPFNSSAGTSGTTPIDYLYISGLIDDILDDDLNALGLNTISKLDADIAAINAINAWDSTTAYLLEEQVTHSGKIWQAVQPSTNQEPSASNSAYWTNVGNYASLADFVSAQGTYANSHITTLDTNQTSIVTTLLNLGVSFNGLSSDLSLNYYTKATADTAIATGIATYTTTLADGSTATLQQTAESTDGNSAKFAVKIDNNDHVSGFGLISTANNSTPTSAFIVAADRFAIAAPSTSTASQSNAVGETEYPFKVFTSNHNLTDDNGNPVLDENGAQVVIPRGAYINDAFIHEAQITTATIGTATITTANIADGAITNATIADTISSVGFNPFAGNHKTGWGLFNNYPNAGSGGFLWCDNANITGAITANSLVLSAGAEIQTLQIAGNAVTVPTYISFSNLNYSVTSQTTYARPTNTSGASTCAHSVSARGGRLLVTCTFGVRTTASGSGSTPEPYIIAKLKVGTDWLYFGNEVFGASECRVGVPQQGSTTSNIECTATLSVATSQNYGTAPYSQVAFPYNNDIVAISLEVKGRDCRLKSCNFTVISCKR